jgi:hypothetical protein
MTLFNKIFGKSQSLKECPRCLGKGHVDWNDIKRLNRELRWIPGTCAYCNGTGKVDLEIENNVPVDTSFLVINLPEYERKRIINGHPDAIERGKQYDGQVEVFINQISYLYFDARLKPLQIAEFFLIGSEDSDSYEDRKQELLDYIEKVVQKKTNED